MFLEERFKDLILSNDIIQSVEELKELRELINEFLSDKILVPPLQQDEVIMYSSDFIKEYPKYQQFQKLIAVLINNNTWQPIIEKIPYNRRILLLPKCLRHSEFCPAKMDELGLLCEQCGRCLIDEIIKKTSELGYHSIVSEGTGAVSVLLSSGQIECVIGVGCLDSFERSFPLAVKEAIPSIGIPLFNSDCKDSRTDSNWIFEILPVKNGQEKFNRLNLEELRKEVQLWFSTDNLKRIIGNENESVIIANKWLEAGGKRWRPLIMKALYDAMGGNESLNSESLMRLAISIESFHKASLVHDDIADEDSERYDKPTLHEEYDIPVALNTGDLLTGYGYQLIAQAGLDAHQTKKILEVAAKGHRDLCIGQGQELLLRRKTDIASLEETLEIFIYKTAPAFEVALKFGAIVSNGNKQLLNTLGSFSKNLGIAYQIQDDLEDFKQESSINDIESLRLSLVLAILGKSSPKKMNNLINRFHQNDISVVSEIYALAKKDGAIEKAQLMLKEYKQKALDSLTELENADVKILLYRLTNRIIKDI